uniref:HTH CENPB-type domain-containing protein n=1 Tax=Erpetoichthys calabaricus TaxID=27687 RepID=A0A8C4RFJ1_ERPCA
THTVYTLHKQCSFLKFEPERKWMRTAKYEDLETALLVWFKQARSQNAPISGPLMLERSNELAKQMGITFSANPGWLERFKKRNDIVLKNVCGEANQSTLPSILEEYEVKDVFNADETGLFYHILEFVQSSKNIIDADSDDENEMNNAAPVPTSSEMRNIMKSMRSYLDAHSNGEMNNKIDDIEQFVDNLMLKKTMQRKYQIFQKLNKCFVFQKT